MPVYEYECTQCGQIKEAFQKISDSPLQTCSECKGELKKLISHSSFHLKGSGWYATDYSNSSSSTKSGGPTVADKKENKTTSKKNDTSNQGSK